MSQWILSFAAADGADGADAADAAAAAGEKLKSLAGTDGDFQLFGRRFQQY